MNLLYILKLVSTKYSELLSSNYVHHPLHVAIRLCYVTYNLLLLLRNVKNVTYFYLADEEKS